MRRALIAASVVFVLAAASYVVVGVATAPKLPAAPELDGVDLSAPPEGPRSELLHAALGARYPAYEGLDPSFFSHQLERIHEGEWLEDPNAVLTMIGAASSLPSAVRAGLEAPGCIREDPLAGAELLRHIIEGRESPEGAEEELIRPHMLVRAVELMVLAEVARAQRGQRQDATRSLLGLLRDLRRHQDECPNTVVLSTVLEVCLSLVHTSLGFLIADPEHDPEIWQRALPLEQAESPLADAVRNELAAYRRTRQDVPGPAGPSRAERQVLELLERADRRVVWLAELPGHHEALRAPSVEEEHDRALRERSRLFRFVASSSIPAQAVSLAATTIEMNRVMFLSWHRDHCQIALQRAGWQRDLRARGRALPAAPASSPPRDLLRDEVIDLDDGRRRPCTLDLDEGSRARPDVAPLPPYPPPT